MDVPVFSDALCNDDDEVDCFRQLAKTRIQARIRGMSDLDGTNSYFIPELTSMVTSVHDAIYDNGRCDATMMRGHWIHITANNVGRLSIVFRFKRADEIPQEKWVHVRS